MKTFFTLLTILLISLPVFAQNNSKQSRRLLNLHQQPAMVSSMAKTQVLPFSFTYYTSTYTEFSGGTSITNGFTWDDPDFVIQPGFTVDLLGTMTDSLVQVGYGTDLTDSYAFGNQPFLSTIYDFIDRASDTINWAGQPGGVSDISWIVNGAAPNRILKIQWKNAGFWDDINDDNLSTDYMNMQYWFYENTGDVEIHFGPNSITQPSLIYYGFPGPIIAAMAAYDFQQDSVISAMFLTGNATSPVGVDTTDVLFLSGNIPANMVFKFQRIQVSADEDIQAGSIQVYPNPASDFLLISNDQTLHATAKLFDMTGKMFVKKELSGTESKIETGLLSPGMYILQLTDESGIRESRKVIIE